MVVAAAAAVGATTSDPETSEDFCSGRFVCLPSEANLSLVREPNALSSSRLYMYIDNIYSCNRSSITSVSQLG